MKALKSAFKKHIYGTIPLLFCRVFRPDSPAIKYHEYIKAHGYKRHIYEFREEYDRMNFSPQKDPDSGLYYVLNRQGRRLYFKRDLLADKIERSYRMLVIEQDLRSPHHYLDTIQEVSGKTFVDIGSAEGFTSLEVVEEADRVFLFEQDELWIEALEATFKPWKEKVTIIRKYVSDKDNEQEITLDTFFQDKEKEHLFLKMDIEGAERYALCGGKKLFNEQKLHFAICTYHGNDNIVIPDILKEYNCQYIEQFGFFRHKLRSVVVRGATLL